ncbi:MAG: type II toxin-antitoxin system VapC family toxin, partial [Chloroflexi bacterium]|nr:type II toxin-antitoxin system VapC family toxin [Chloroflexota bacterium]
IDASAIIAVIANEPEKERLIEITQGADLLAPASIHWEIGNAFSAMIKRERITLAQAQNAIAIYKQIPIRFVEVELEDTLEIVSTHGIYAYDAYLIRCAIKYKSALITLDRKLAQVAQAMHVSVAEVD